MAAAFGAGARVAIAQRAAPGGLNETLAARALPETLALDGAPVAGDAMRAQAGAAKAIPERGGDRLFALKANRRDNGPETLAILRRLTLNPLDKARPEMSIARKRKRSGWSDAFARSISGHMR